MISAALLLAFIVSFSAAFPIARVAAEESAPEARAVVYGLVFTALLTPVLIPANILILPCPLGALVVFCVVVGSPGSLGFFLDWAWEWNVPASLAVFLAAHILARRHFDRIENKHEAT